MKISREAHVPPLARGDALFLDFDGTLVDIADAPDRVSVGRWLPKLLKRVDTLLNGAIAVISGRTLANLDFLLRPFHGAAAGVHGFQRRTANGEIIVPPPDPSIKLIRPLLENFVAKSPGLLLEDKHSALALHFRARPDLADACTRVADHARILAEGRLVLNAGKMVVELYPKDVSKGRAILDYLGEPAFRGRRPVFVGDDQTDEDGFEMVNRLGGHSIFVGASRDSFARYRFDDVPDVTMWIAAFVTTSSKPRHPRDAEP